MASRVVVLSAVFVLCSGQSWNTNPGYPNQSPYGAGASNPYGQTTDRYNQGFGGAGAFGSNNFGGNALGGGNSLEPFRVLYEWFKLDYNWVDEMTKSQALSNRRFIPENNALAGVKTWRDRIFVTIPRWKEGVPVTIASVPAQPLQPNASPRLDPFPNWQMQEIGNCTAFQFVQSIEIDTEGRIWVLDVGRTNTLTGGAGGIPSRCPPKLVIIDLNSVQFQGGQFPGQYPGQTGFPGSNQPYPNQQPGYNPQYPNQQPGYNSQYPQPGQPGYNSQYPNPQPGQPGYNSQYPNPQPGQPGYNSQYPQQGQPGYNSQYPNPQPGQPGYNSQYPQTNQPGYNSQYPNPQPGQPGYNSQYPQNNQPGYNSQYPQPGQPGYNANQQYRPNQYNQQGQYNQFNNTPRYDQFGNPVQQPYPGQPGFNQPGFYPGLNFGSNFRIIRSFNFPSNVATPFGNNMKEMVLDNTDGWFAYISDHGDDPGIIVYSFQQDRSWKVKDARSMRSDPDVGFVSINNIDVELRGKNIDGLALSSAAGYERTLYFSPLGSYNLYSLPTSSLKNPALSSDVSTAVVDLGRKPSISDGMIMDNRGNLYFGLLGLNAVGVWNTKQGRFTDSQRILARDTRALQWPSSFAIDDGGNLLVVTNRLQNYLTGRVSLDEPNYRILRAPIGGRSYMAPADFSAGIGGRSNNGYNSFDVGYNSYNYWNGAGVSTVATGLLALSAVLIFLNR